MEYYEILGVDENADENDIKKSYRKLALQYHPDQNQGNKRCEEKFKQINKAYKVLSSFELRSQYDEMLLETMDENIIQESHDNYWINDWELQFYENISQWTKKLSHKQKEIKLRINKKIVSKHPDFSRF